MTRWLFTTSPWHICATLWGTMHRRCSRSIAALAELTQCCRRALQGLAGSSSEPERVPWLHRNTGGRSTVV